LSAAVALAEKNDAHVVGLFVTHARLAFTGLYSLTSPYIHPDTSAIETKWRTKAEEAFTKALANTGLSYEFRHVSTIPSDPMDTLIAQVRLADVFITGIDTDWNDNAVSQSDALGQIIEGAGRPIIIVPEKTDYNPKFDTVSIGWDGSRECIRAVFDAIPILHHYAQCSLISVNVDRADMDARRQSATRMIETLGRHDIVASYDNIKAHGSDIKALRKVGEESDLMILGAYHHRRLRERIFGGVTVSILNSPPCPVFLAR
jgi:nucleotide-binding universal stress UspA family protein